MKLRCSNLKQCYRGDHCRANVPNFFGSYKATDIFKIAHKVSVMGSWAALVAENIVGIYMLFSNPAEALCIVDHARDDTV